MTKYTALTLTQLAELHAKGIIKQSSTEVRKNKAGKEFVGVYFKSADPLDKSLTVRNVTANNLPDGTPNWGTAGSGLNLLKSAQGYVKQGLRTTETVVPYDITSDGRTITTNKFTMVIFEGEDKAVMFSRAGHPLATETAVVTQPATALATSEDVPA